MSPAAIALLLVLALAAPVGGLVAARHTRRRRELERSEGYYRRAVQVGHIGYWRVEFPSGTVLWSDEMFSIFGLPRSTQPSLELKFSMYHPADAGTRMAVAEAIEQCREWQVDHRILRPDCSIRHVKSEGMCERDARGEVRAVFGVVIDTTELEAARREAEAAAESKAAFLANMSHEIRTPMNGVMGFVELLTDSKLDARQRRHLLLVQESAQALLKLLNDILDLSKIEAGHFEISLEPANVRHEITQCVRLMTPAAEHKGLKLKVGVAAGFPDSVLLDSLRVRQVLFNLLGNAVKFTNEGSVVVALSEATGPTGRRLIEITVTDTGVGIADNRKESIFDAFVQADPSVSRCFGGSGLGLSVSRSLVDLMGGTISLASDEGVGTVVTLNLPLEEGLAPAVKTVVAPPARPAAVSGPGNKARRGASILLVEDIDINQELITEMLKRLGHTIDLARNGAEAVRMARRLAKEPKAWDMILMDVQMPVMDGLSATRAIRALGGRAATIPIVALTANAFAAEMQDCHDAGMDDHLAKPSGFAELKRAVEMWGNVVLTPAPATGFGELATISVADRFAARLRTSTERLIELTAELAATEDEASMLLLGEAAGIAHMIAGTAGMFGRAPLGTIALEVESEIKAIVCSDASERDARAAQAVERLIAALRATPLQPDGAVAERAA